MEVATELETALSEEAPSLTPVETEANEVVSIVEAPEVEVMKADEDVVEAHTSSPSDMVGEQ